MINHKANNKMVGHIYDNIPLEYIGNNILEIGVNNRILQSKIASKIISSDYLGIDIEERESILKTVQADIIDYNISKKYDTILILEVFEHIKLCYWKDIINKLKSALVKGGYLIVSTPYNQKLSQYLSLPYNENFGLPKDNMHTVFGINKKVIKYFFPNSKYKILWRVFWRQDNCRRIWAIMRFFNRLFFGSSPFRRTVMIFYTCSNNQR